MSRPIIALLCVVILLGGCNSRGGVKNKVISLDDAIEGYLAALRWGRYQDAYRYHADKDGGQPALPLDNLEQIRVTAYDVHEKNVNDEVTEASVKGEIKYYHTDYGTVRKLPLHQLWWYEAEAKAWYLEGEMPTFR